MVYTEWHSGKKADALRDFDQAFKLNPDLKPQYKEFIKGNGDRSSSLGELHLAAETFEFGAITL